MPFDPRQFDIDGRPVAWGTTLREVSQVLEAYERPETYGGSPYLTCRCRSIFGLQAAEMGISAPLEDRPVLQVRYELAPVRPGFWESSHVPYVRQLTEVLGPPRQSGRVPGRPRLKKADRSGEVVYTASWLHADILISLSVYGGIREEKSGPAAAGLFIDWRNEMMAARPYREKARQFEALLDSHLTQDIPLQKFRLRCEQQPFRLAHYGSADPEKPGKDRELRAAQMALYKKALYLTPEIIGRRLEANEAALYSVPALDKVIVSTKWDTVYLEPEDKNPLVYENILPARGPGYRQLNIKELRLMDSRESDTLMDILGGIQKETGFIAEMREYYDD